MGPAAVGLACPAPLSGCLQDGRTRALGVSLGLSVRLALYQPRDLHRGGRHCRGAAPEIARPPEQAARDFLYGHLRIELAILFDEAGFPFSDGALLAIEQAKAKIFQQDWKKVMTLDSIQTSVKDITHARDSAA